jgi:hypothetical protein
MLLIYIDLDFALTLPHNTTSSTQLKTKSFQLRYPCNLLAIMSAQTPHALTIPEILCEILDHLEFDPKTLFAACLVNKAWTGPSLDRIWCSHDWTGVERLESLPECQRQFYADKIRSLKIKSSPIQCGRYIETLNFPRLRKLMVWLTDDWDFSHLLVPTLEEFAFYNSIPQGENYLRQLPERCPNLRGFYFGRHTFYIEFNRLGDYLKRFSKLQSVDLEGISDSAMTDEVFIRLASLPLCEIHMKKLITSEMIDLAHKRLEPDSSFSNAGYLDLRMEWRAATMLVPTLTTLRRLELTLVSGDTNHKAF